MNSGWKTQAVVGVLLLVVGMIGVTRGAAEEGWHNWRGPDQTGTSRETGLFESVTLNGEGHLWTYELHGRGTPVIAGDRLYTLGYRGEGADLQEVLVCLNARTGKLIWEEGFNDFLSDIIYNRYSIGSPTIDPETGFVYMLSTAGEMTAFTDDGRELWRFSMAERFGRLTFPNGRTGSPVIDQDLVIIHTISAYWGANGPARDRFYAFDKKTGELVWLSTPGVRPTDSSFATPVLAWQNGQRVLYCGTGCGNIVCINVRNGKPLWRYQFLNGGVNSSIVLHQNKTLVAIHGKENLDSSKIGRMIGLDVGRAYGEKQEVLTADAELWRNDLGIFTSSPTLAGDRVFQVDHYGDLHSIDVKTGEIRWTQKLSNGQLHASPLYADGKLYVPMRNGLFYVLRPTATGAEVLCRLQLEGECLGSPSVWNGRVYVHSTEKLYCFGAEGDNPGRPRMMVAQKPPTADKATELQIVPSDVLLEPGDRQNFSVVSLDENGQKVRTVRSNQLDWESFIPPTARVKTRLNGLFVDSQLRVKGQNVSSAGAFKATNGKGVSGLIRARALAALPFGEDFNGYELSVSHARESGVQFAYPPLAWIGARFKWEVREVGGEKVFAKTLDRPLFQRALTFIGHPDLTGYTMEADVMSDGNRRGMSDVGLINQRYMIVLKGNQQLLEVSSNHDRLKVGVPFVWDHKTWYRLKCRVDLNVDGSGVVRGKAWERGTAEPEGWQIEVPHRNAHPKGSPGLFGFSPQSQFRVYVDNVKVYKTP